jgi:hypothetical protein
VLIPAASHRFRTKVVRLDANSFLMNHPGGTASDPPVIAPACLARCHIRGPAGVSMG